MPIILDGTKGETFPTWTTGTRPATPNAGQTGYNSTLSVIETYNGTGWASGLGAVTSSTTNTNTNKIAVNINGTVYYLLASTSGT
jgi:hypothetical protein